MLRCEHLTGSLQGVTVLVRNVDVRHTQTHTLSQLQQSLLSPGQQLCLEFRSNRVWAMFQRQQIEVKQDEASNQGAQDDQAWPKDLQQVMSLRRASDYAYQHIVATIHKKAAVHVKSCCVTSHKRKKRKVYAVLRHDSRPQTREQPQLITHTQGVKCIARIRACSPEACLSALQKR